MEQDFSAAGGLHSDRRSRIDTNWAEIELFLNANVERIPHEIPSISLNSIRKYPHADDGSSEAQNMDVAA